LLATNFKEQPLVEARLRMSIGKSFFHLGNFVKAQHEFTRARKLFTETLGSEHPETLSSMHSFASSYVAENGVSPEMLALREDTLKLRMNKLGRYHPDTLASMGALAYSYVMVGHNDKALKLYSEAVALCEEKLGADDQQTLGNISGLALTSHALGHYQDARDLYEKVHKIYRTKFGPEHPYTLESGRTLAWCYVYLNRQAEALMLFSRIFELSKVKLGADHPTTLLTENGVIRSLHKLGRTAEAIAMIDEFVGLEHENRRWRLIMEALLIRLRYFAETKNAIECQKTADIWERKLNKKEWLHVRTAVVMRTVTAGVSAQKGNAGAAEEQASRAMRWLQYLDSFGALRAVDMEHNDQDIPRSQPDFKKEDLDILRSRPDFKSLLAKLRRTK
jgi:tetratricopeptide (TPR) repeat protein